MKNVSLLTLIFATSVLAQSTTPPDITTPPPGHDIRHHPPKPCNTTDSSGRPLCDETGVPVKIAPNAPPTIPTEVMVEYYKKQAAMEHAKSQLQNTQQFKELDSREADLQSTLSKISLICGEHNLVSQDDKGDPVCIIPPKPEVKRPAPKPAEKK